MKLWTMHTRSAISAMTHVLEDFSEQEEPAFLMSARLSLTEARKSLDAAIDELPNPSDMKKGIKA